MQNIFSNQRNVNKPRLLLHCFSFNCLKFFHYSFRHVGDDVLHWKFLIEGPEKTAYEDGLFEIHFKLHEKYPFKHPEVIFETKTYHPNIDKEGKICELVLGKNWSPQIQLMECLRIVRHMMSEPDLTSPLAPEIAKQYAENRKEFDKKARQCVKDNCPKKGKK